ncbi:hypothetical protein C8F04DRAFT_1090413 [Mycena alexandri]|uniref:histidine kinase n=1 Tax=Mycena alexandri TaxID=1745969 RepID=A0AAD6T143_9AGAR|nr:hypothetical protein C8F04DRAFT_1090413 [Mycena alexandri]
MTGLATLDPGPEEEDTDFLGQWVLFLRDYAKGIERPTPPALQTARTSKSAPSGIPSFEVPLYPPGEISRETARVIAEFYEEHGFLPPPRADEEPVRQAVIREYNLFREDQAENFHRCSSLVNAFFPFAPICTISLFHNDTQVIVSKGGDFPVALGERLVTETSICGHVVLKKNGETTELREIADDWRFLGNPWTSIDTGVKGYIGVPITLEVDPANPQQSERVTVGVIALMGNSPFPKLTDIQTKVLDDLSSMLSVQLRSTWEGWRRGKEMRLRNAVSLFLEKALVDPSQKAIRETTAMAEPPVEGSESGRSTPSLRSADAEMLTSGIFASAAEQLQELLEADFAIIVDLTPFHATNTPGSRRLSHSWANGHRILSSWSSKNNDLEHAFDTPQAMAAIARFLDSYFVHGRSVFSGSDDESELEGLLSFPSITSPSAPVARGLKSSRVSENIPHLALPFYSANRPNLLIVVASAAPFFSFHPSDVTFVSNLGAMLVAHLAQRIIVEADAAKTAFVSQISHELRTPLHGLLGQLELVRESFVIGELSSVPALLDSAEFCGAALRGIVDDVLDFGKMAQSLRGDQDVPALLSRPVLMDLVQTTLETARGCWFRRLQWEKANAVSTPQPGSEPPPFLELAVEYEDRSMLKNWWVSLDATGFTRILNNLITNSLKYTAVGMITVSLVTDSGSDEDGDDTPQIILRVEDTGRGIAPEFLSKIWDPFTQADSFSPGAGLGMHITKSVVDRMNGTIAVDARPGGGTIFTVVLPVRDMEIPPRDQPRLMRRKIVSSEAIPKTPEAPLSPPLSEDALPQATTPLSRPASTTPSYFDQPDTKTRSTTTSPPTTPTNSASNQVGEPLPPTKSPAAPTSGPVLPPEDEPPDAPPDTPPLQRTTPRLSPQKPTARSPNRAPEQENWPPDPNHPQPTSPPLSPDKVAGPSQGTGKDEIRLTVLVVDDNAIARKLLVQMLKRENVTAHQADDGVNAVTVFREVHPHVVWTDISMPRMDGVTAAAEMRKIERENGWTPSHIVAITGLGLTDEHVRREALLGPAALDAWMIKGQTNLKTLKESLVVVREKLKSQL